MVRTKASISSSSGIRAVAAKAPRKTVGSSYSGGHSSSSGTSTPSKKSDKFSGGNSYFPRPTPQWQKPISGFFSVQAKDKSISKSITDVVDDGVNKENIDPGVSGTSLKNKKTSSLTSNVEGRNKELHTSKSYGVSSGSDFAGPSSSSSTAGSSGLSTTAGSSGIKEKRRRLTIESDSDDD